MDIATARERKQLLEREIAESVRRFERDTGLTLASVDVLRGDNTAAWTLRIADADLLYIRTTVSMR